MGALRRRLGLTGPHRGTGTAGHATPARRDPQAGMSMTELLAYLVLSGIVLAVVGTLLVRTLVTQRDVRAQAVASSAAQVTLTDIEGALRNAVTVQTPSTFDGRLLLVTTRVGDDDTAAASFQCRAWLYDPGSGDLLTLRATPGPAAATRGLTPATDLSTWQVALADVRPSTSGAQPLPVFSAEGATGAHIRFEVLDGEDGSSQTITSAAIPRPQGTSTGEDTCF